MRPGEKRSQSEKLIKNRIRIVDIFYVFEKNEMHKYTPFVDLKIF